MPFRDEAVLLYDPSISLFISEINRAMTVVTPYHSLDQWSDKLWFHSVETLKMTMCLSKIAPVALFLMKNRQIKGVPGISRRPEYHN